MSEDGIFTALAASAILLSVDSLIPLLAVPHSGNDGCAASGGGSSRSPLATILSIVLGTGLSAKLRCRCEIRIKLIAGLHRVITIDETTATASRRRDRRCRELAEKPRGRPGGGWPRAGQRRSRSQY